MHACMYVSTNIYPTEHDLSIYTYIFFSCMYVCTKCNMIIVHRRFIYANKTLSKCMYVCKHFGFIMCVYVCLLVPVTFSYFVG